MIELYGTDACPDCIIAKMLFEKYGIVYKYINVSQIKGFTGEIPRIKLDDEAIIIGVGELNQFLSSTFND